MGHDTCCVVNCKNNGRNSNKKFYTFPQSIWKQEQRMKWIIAVNRKNADGSPWCPKPHDKICSAHFIGGKKADELDSPSYVPRIFPATYICTRLNTNLAKSSLFQSTMGHRKCHYLNCVNTNTTRSLFAFPVNDESLLRLWITHSGNAKLESLTHNKLKSRFICEDHFKKEDVWKSSRHKLAPKTVPLMFQYVTAPSADCSSEDDIDHFNTNLSIRSYHAKSHPKTSEVTESAAAEPPTIFTSYGQCEDLPKRPYRKRSRRAVMQIESSHYKKVIDLPEGPYLPQTLPDPMDQLDLCKVVDEVESLYENQLNDITGLGICDVPPQIGDYTPKIFKVSESFDFPIIDNDLSRNNDIEENNYINDSPKVNHASAPELSHAAKITDSPRIDVLPIRINDVSKIEHTSDTEDLNRIDDITSINDESEDDMDPEVIQTHSNNKKRRMKDTDDNYDVVDVEDPRNHDPLRVDGTISTCPTTYDHLLGETPERHEQVVCNNCKGDVVGSRYVCVQCSDYDLCVTCESTGHHATHYVLRVPAGAKHAQVSSVIQCVRRQLMFLQTSEETVEIKQEAPDMPIKEEVEEMEIDEADIMTGESDTEPSHVLAFPICIEPGNHTHFKFGKTYSSNKNKKNLTIQEENNIDLSDSVSISKCDVKKTPVPSTRRIKRPIIMFEKEKASVTADRTLVEYRSGRSPKGIPEDTGEDSMSSWNPHLNDLPDEETVTERDNR